MNRLINFIKMLGAALLCTFLVDAHANNISIEQAFYSGYVGDELNVTVSYDFTSFNMFGGSFNLIYDPTVLEFVSYTQAELESGPDGPEPAASPLGEFVSTGNYAGAGIGTFEDGFGISIAGDIGTFVFVLLQHNSNVTTPCGATICLTPSTSNPFVSVAGSIVDDEIFSNGIAAASVQVVPLPASVWFLISALGAVVIRLKY